jgi:hypothetical protein
MSGADVKIAKVKVEFRPFKFFFIKSDVLLIVGHNEMRLLKQK